MNLNIEIDREKCIKCGKCVRICPSLIFFQQTPKSEVECRNRQSCILCGHCVSVCPTYAVLHSEFPYEKVHEIDRSRLPDAEQLMLLIASRRSNRAFTDKPVPRDLLSKIVEAGYLAPTASNMQKVEFTVVTDAEKLRAVTKYTMDTFLALRKKLMNPFLKPFIKAAMPDAYKALPLFDRLIAKYESGYDPVLRGATALILIHTPKSVRFGVYDANLSYQNASLMAETLGVTQFYTGFLMTAIGQDKKNRLAAELGIDGVIHAGMALALPAFKYPRYADRKEVKVNYL